MITAKVLNIQLSERRYAKIRTTRRERSPEKFQPLSSYMMIYLLFVCLFFTLRFKARLSAVELASRFYHGYCGWDEKCLDGFMDVKSRLTNLRNHCWQWFYANQNVNYSGRWFGHKALSTTTGREIFGVSQLRFTFLKSL